MAAYKIYVPPSTITKNLAFNALNLQEMKKAGRLKIQGWKVELINPQIILQKIKREQQKTLDSLYILAFLNCKEDFIHK